MVTMQNWMFLRKFVEMRAFSKEKLDSSRKSHRVFKGLLRDTNIEVLSQLGANAFEEIKGEVVQNVMFTLLNQPLVEEHKIIAFRLVGVRSTKEKIQVLSSTKLLSSIRYTVLQKKFLDLPQYPLCYWLPDHIVNMLQDHLIGSEYACQNGVTTYNNNRFLRKVWEVQFLPQRILSYAKGGGYQKWAGLEQDALMWGINGESIKAYIDMTYPYLKGNYGWALKENTFFVHGWCWTLMAQGALGVRRLDGSTIFDSVSPAIFGDYIKPGIKLLLCVQSILHSVEGLAELIGFTAFKLNAQDQKIVIDETGTPAGWYPLIIGYDTLPPLPDNLDMPPLPQELFDYLAEHKRIVVNDKELTRIKSNLKALYMAGPHAKGVEQEEREEIAEESEEGEGEEEMASGAHIPIPTETFLEELSVKMELHPISVYWLLEELRAEGIRCLPEERRLLEDRLSVLVLRLLGHCWPKQLEAEEPVPTWAEEHGIIPLVSGTGRATLAERVRERLQIEDGALETQQTEALLQELTGKTLEQWLRSNFFAKHVQQFKSRPIAWHLASTPIKGEKIAGSTKKRRGTTEPTTHGPAFECLLYYHACSRSALTRIRTQYVEPLLQAERDKVERGGRTLFAANDGQQQETLLVDDDGMIPFAKLRIRELEDFVARLQQIEESGFETPELQTLLADEPLDRWSGDGLQAPKNADALYRAEKAWDVDINDGVRVNIAPLQLAGVLTGVVLAKASDAKKALIDRSRWRADERRWVRAGKLPRCGWMDEQIPASAAWLEREASKVHTTTEQQALMERTEASEV